MNAKLSVPADVSGAPSGAPGDDPPSDLAIGTDPPRPKAVEQRPTAEIAPAELAGLLAESDLARVVEEDALLLAKGSSPEAAHTQPPSLPAITPPADDEDRATRKMDAGQFQELIAHGVPMERRQRAKTMNDPARLNDALREMGDDEELLAIPVEPSIVVAPEPAKPAAVKAEPHVRHHREALAPITRPPHMVKPPVAGDTEVVRYPDAGRSDLALAIAITLIILGAIGSVGLLVL